MTRYIFDADAWLCARTLGLTQRFLGGPSAYLAVLFTQYVARHELNSLESELLEGVNRGVIRIEKVEFNRPEHLRLRKTPGVHKGEAEALAWLLLQVRDRRPVFVTRDAGAARAAKKERVSCTEVLGFAADLLTIKIVPEEELRVILSVWDDRSRQICRPADWQGFDVTLEKRLRSAFPYFC